MTTIPDLHVGHGITAGPVTLFPVWADAAPLPNVVTGTAARLSVTELPDGAAVPHLTVTNLGPKPALLLEGELLEGGLQTRALAFDLLIEPQTSAVVDVACVEHGRWAGSNSHDRRARHTSASVHHRLRGDKASRQHDVWASVARFDQATGPTDSGSFADHLDRLPEEDVEVARVLPGQTGVIIGVAGWPMTIELFGSPSALAAHLPGILAAGRLDALLAGHAEPVPAFKARLFAAAVTGLPLDFTPVHAGYGHAAAGHSDNITARGIATPDGVLAHLSALNLRHELIGAA
jgi:hypothetical protein